MEPATPLRTTELGFSRYGDSEVIFARVCLVMPSAQATLAPQVSTAIEHALGPEHRNAGPVLRPSQFADLQSNAALPLAKRLGMPPRDVAERIVAHWTLKTCATESKLADRASST